MFARLLLLFILVPLIDLFILLGISRLTHWSTTMMIVVLSGVLGAWLAKQQSSSVGGKIRSKLLQNKMPSDLLTDGAMIFFAAGLLITPGVITDLLGLTLLVPISRQWYKRMGMRLLRRYLDVQVTQMKFHQPFDSDVVDGEVVSNQNANQTHRSSDLLK